MHSMNLFTFFPLPSPIDSNLSPTVHLVIKVLMCGGPFSLMTSKLTFKFRFKANSCTSEIGDLRSDDESASIVVTKLSAVPATRTLWNKKDYTIN